MNFFIFSSLLLIIHSVQTQYFIYFPFISNNIKLNNILNMKKKNTLLEKHPYITKFIKLIQSKRVLFDIVYYRNE